MKEPARPADERGRGTTCWFGARAVRSSRSAPASAGHPGTLSARYRASPVTTRERPSRPRAGAARTIPRSLPGRIDATPLGRRREARSIAREPWPTAIANGRRRRPCRSQAVSASQRPSRSQARVGQATPRPVLASHRKSVPRPPVPPAPSPIRVFAVRWTPASTASGRSSVSTPDDTSFRCLTGTTANGDGRTGGERERIRRSRRAPRRSRRSSSRRRPSRSRSW